MDSSSDWKEEISVQSCCWRNWNMKFIQLWIWNNLRQKTTEFHWLWMWFGALNEKGICWRNETSNTTYKSCCFFNVRNVIMLSCWNVILVVWKRTLCVSFKESSIFSFSQRLRHRLWCHSNWVCQWNVIAKSINDEQYFPVVSSNFRNEIDFERFQNQWALLGVKST